MRISIVIVLMILALAGCVAEKERSILIPDVLVDRLINDEKPSGDYYAESITKVIENGELISETQNTEWVVNSKGRVMWRRDSITTGEYKSITIDDGKRLMTYSESGNSGENCIVNYAESTIGDDYPKTHRREFEDFVARFSTTHRMETIGEEKIAGRHCLHISFIPIEDRGGELNAFDGSAEIWIDQESYYILKMIFRMRDPETEIITEYRNYNNTARIDDSIFKPDLPEGTVYERMDIDPVEEVISRAELIRAFGNTLKFWPNHEKYKEKIIRYSMGGEEDSYTYYEIRYSDDLTDMFSMLFNTVSNWNELPEFVDVFDIVGGKAYYLDGSNTLSFTDGNFDYTIVSEDVRIDKDRMVEIAEQMLKGDNR